MSTSATDWPAAWADALSDATLQRASSAAIFQRGKAYAKAGSVEVIAEDPLPEPALRARVTGSEVYATEVWIEDDTIAGDCDCPHADGGWFCKHQVATALVWRERLGGAASAGKVAALPATQTRRTQAQAPANPQDALHHFLHGLPTDVLADKVLQLARHNLDLRHELERWHMLSAIAEYSRECEAGAPADPAPQEADLRNQERQRAKHEALAPSRRQFDLDPSVARYHQVLKAGKAAGDDCALLRLTLLDHLQRREVAACCPADPTAAGSGQPDASALVLVPDVTLRAAILGSEGHWIEACELVQPPAVCDAAVLQHIAAQMPADHREQAVALWLRVLAAVMPHASSPFSEVLSLVRQICQRLDADDRAAWLAHLRLEYKAKRNFVRGLPVR